MASLLTDLRHAARLLARSPGFTAAAVLSLALGVGANATVFTLINAVLLHPLAVSNPSTLISVWTTDERNTGQALMRFLQTSPLNYRDLRDRNQVFSGLAAHTGLPLNLSGGTGEPQQVFGQIVSGNYFSVLGVTPLVGRTFLPDEDQTPGAKLVCVLGYGAWQRRFGGDPAIVGRKILVNGSPFAVVGVMPKDFKGTNAIGTPALWVPHMSYPQTTNGFLQELILPEGRRGLVFNVTGRLKAGVTLEKAEANLRTIARQLEQAYPNDNKGRSVTLVPLAQATINPGFRNNVLMAGGLLMTIVGLVLLIACANVANLLLARAAVRQREIAMRLSLGASRGRLMRQLLTESMLLALLGGVAALALAYWAQQLLWSFRPPDLAPDAMDLRPDAAVLLFTVGVSLATGLLFGLVPAVQASRSDLVAELKEKASVPTGGSRWFGARQLLVAGQVALSLVALVGAGLFVRSLRNAQQIEPGFDVGRLAVVAFDLGAQGYSEERGRQFHRDVLDRVGAIPGVEAATLSNSIPLAEGGFLRTVFLEGQDRSDQRSGRLVQIGIVGPRYFETAGIPLVRGRAFAETDQPGTPAVVVVNETMAKRFWPGQDPLGRRFTFFGQDHLNEVVGIARDSKYNFIGEDPTPFIYQPLTQVYAPDVSVFARGAHPAAIIGPVRSVVQQFDRNMPLTNVFTLSEVFARSLWAARMGAWLLAVFAGLSLVLAVVGIYGVMAYSVTQRTRELGIRMALGASRREVLGLVVGRGLWLLGLGVVSGLVVALLLTRLVASMLYGVSATDVVTYVAVTLALASAAMAASYLPARRATRIDPVVALRYE